MADKDRSGNVGGSFGGGLGLMTVVGAAVYFVGQEDGFWNIVLALLKALVWPAFAVYGVLDFFDL